MVVAQILEVVAIFYFIDGDITNTEARLRAIAP